MAAIGKFIFKFMLLITVLIVGVFIGMEKANQGMLSMKGYEDSSLPAPVHVSENKDGKIEAAFLGKEINHTDEISRKKEELEEIETFNLFSFIGKSLAEFVTAVTKTLIDFIMSLF